MSFLNTACRKENTNPAGVLPYLDTIQGEDKDGYGTLELSTKEKFYQLESYRVSSTMGKELISDLSFLNGIDINQMALDTLENEAIVGNQRLLLSKYISLGEITRDKDLKKSRWNRFLLRFISESQFSFHFNSPDDLIKKILVKSNHIGVRSRRGNGDFIICPPKYATYIMESPSFAYRTTREVSESPANIDFIGTIRDRIQVFIDRNASFTEDRILIGRRTSESDPGVYFINGDKSTEEFMDTEGNKKIILEYRQAIFNTEGCEGSFDIIRVNDSKRPFWKKLFCVK
jgi:hypothetical protein